MRIYPFIVIILALIAANTALSATYNFYFNNTEQGDNSKASPSLTVQTDENGNPIEPAKDEQEPSGTEDEIKTEQSQATPTQESSVRPPPKAPRKFRIGLSTLSLDENGDAPDRESRSGWQANGSIFLGKMFAFNAAVGSVLLWGYQNKMYQVEAEFLPLVFANYYYEDKVSIGLVGGYTSIQGVNADISEAHAGIKLNLRFSDHLGMELGFRAIDEYVNAGQIGLSYLI